MCRTLTHVRAEGFTGTLALAEGEKAAWSTRKDREYLPNKSHRAAVRWLLFAALWLDKKSPHAARERQLAAGVGVTKGMPRCKREL